MKRNWLVILLLTATLIGVVVIGGIIFTNNKKTSIHPMNQIGYTIKLDEPELDSHTSVERALYERRSIRTYSNEPLTMKEVSQILWAAQGITHPDGYRTSPSAGALYPLEIYLVVGNVIDIPAGVYHYLPIDHALEKWIEGDKRSEIYKAALNQDAVRQAAITLVIAAIYERTTQKYGQRGIRYVNMEVGHAAQNVYLQVESLGLGTVFIGAFYDEMIQSILKLEKNMQPLGLMPIGRKP